MLPFQGLGLVSLCFQVRVDLYLVGVVIGERRRNLSQRQMTELARDLFRDEARVVRLSNPANGDTCPGNARPASANVWLARNQVTNLSYTRHRPQV